MVWEVVGFSHDFNRIPSVSVAWLPRSEKPFETLCLHVPANFGRSHRIR